MKLIKILCLLLFVGASATAFGQKQLPSVEVKTLDGQVINIQEFAENGKITVLSFWATWCSPCKKELDAIADLYPDWQEEYDMELVAITIDTQRALAKVNPMVAAKAWEYVVLSDVNQDLKNALNFQTVPQTYLLDQDGNIVYIHSGYVPGDEYELEDKIKALAE
jgi:peroxiredoxin